MQMKRNNSCSFFIFCLLSLFAVCLNARSVLATVIIQSQVTVGVELKGYNGLTEISLFRGKIIAGEKQTVNTPYRGLALLVFEKGQRYPIILGEESFILKIEDPATVPSCTGSAENELFYKLLTGAEPGSAQYNFPLLMIEAKQLLDSTHSIHTVDELMVMKERFHTFIGIHYHNLQHSDMLIRLISQYFMMHEYVDFHVLGAPASDIQVQYKKVVINGVRNWIRILKMHIPEHEVLNYCVSLYYNRSMVSLAYHIIETFRDIAYCPGEKKETIRLPKNLSVIEANGKKEKQFLECKGRKLIAFVSAKCPVSMVETVIRARILVEQKNDTRLVVVPLEPLSGSFFAMNRMVRNGNMTFVNDAKWQKKNFTEIKLPLFIYQNH